MSLLRKFPAVPLFDHGQHHSSFPANSRSAAVHTAVGNGLSHCDPKSGCKPARGCAACLRRPQGPRHSRRLDATSTVLGVNVHGPRNSHSRMRAQR
jgi:hypothetical protein